MDQTPPPAKGPAGKDESRGDGGRPVESTIELCELARGGDPHALDRLYHRYLPRLRRWASGRMPAAARGVLDTDDLVQDVMLRTVRRLDAFDPHASGGFHAYLRQSLMNRVRDEARRSRRNPEPLELSGDEASSSPSPLQEAIGREQLDRYEAALSRLKPEDREALIARIEMGLGYDEVAETLGKNSANAARMAVVRALGRLLREMNGEAGDEE